MAGWRDISLEQRQDLLNRFRDGEHPDDLVKLVKDDYDVKIEAGTLTRRLQELNNRPPVDVIEPLSRKDGFERYLKMFYTLIGRDPRRPIVSHARRGRPGRTRNVVILCDLHGDPQHDLIAKALRDQPDLIVLDGDVFDAFALSEFPKDEDIPVEKELAAVRAMLEGLAGVPIQMNSGNHDDRAKKYFQRRISPALMPLVKFNLLEMVALGLPHVEVVKNTYSFSTPQGKVFDGAIRNDWITHLGEDAIVGHAETSRKGEGRSVAAFAEWVDKWRRPLGWPEPRLIVQAHVHRGAKLAPNGGHRILVEGGFSGNVRKLQYTHDFGATKYDPPVFGYTRLKQCQEGGRWMTDRSSVDFVIC